MHLRKLMSFTHTYTDVHFHFLPLYEIMDSSIIKFVLE